MRRRAFIIAAAVTGILPRSAVLQEPRRPRIGFLVGGPGQGLPKEWEPALAALGYVDGKTAVFIRRYAEADFSRLPALAAELVQAQVDVILTSTTMAAFAAKAATREIPIVFGNSGDAVGSGLVTNLARPEGNLTGNSFLGTEFAAKQIQFIRELVPGVRRVAFFANWALVPERLFFEQMWPAAHGIGIELDFVDVRAPDAFEAAFERIASSKPDAAVVAPGGFSNLADHRAPIIRVFERNALPAIYFRREFPEEGGLASYGPDFGEMFRRQVLYADRILKGAKPSDLPIEQPTRFELVVNLKTAIALGIAIPPAILARAEEVIE